MSDLVTPMALRVAATLHLADHIEQGLTTAPALAEEVGADPSALARLMEHLVTAGVLTREGEEDEGGCEDAERVVAYELTPRGEALCDDHPSALRAQLDLETAIGHAELCFVQLLHSVRTGEGAYAVQFGLPFWDDLRADPDRTASYDAQMGLDAAEWALTVVPAYDWGSLGHVTDVGGGNGTLLAALLTACPTLHGTVLEQPATAAAARETLRAAGLADRGDAVAGSFFDPLTTTGSGGYLLSAILHDWDDRAAVTILRRCAEAARTGGGSVFVIEKTGAGGESPSTAMDLRMLAYFGGRERGVSALTALAAQAGLRVAAVHPAGPLSIIEMPVADPDA
ncbi:methyltransferase [Streptomyces sp. N2-109]|uniref:Methyltransferase n=2 Tax=Streptomyces gossypii TaxID=2883101 RepID=A0ABT2JMG8_9ACTN|nr:methyltransferase [Streptomyces gossypii]